MRLHYHPASPYSRKVRAALLEREEPHEAVVLDVRGGALRDPAFRAMSPFGKMPVLETSDGPIFESTTILEYLEERPGAHRKLLPRGAERVARQWDRIGDLYLTDPLSELWFRPTAPGADAQLATVRTAWDLLDQRLLGRDFVCGDIYTLGDLSAAIATDMLGRLGHAPPARVAAWLVRVGAMPGFAAARDESAPYLERMLAPRRS